MVLLSPETLNDEQQVWAHEEKPFLDKTQCGVLFELDSFKTQRKYRYQIQNLSKVRNPEKQNYWSIFTRTYNHEKINPFLANVPILHPLKTRGYKMGTLARNGLMRKSKEIKQNWTEPRNFG